MSDAACGLSFEPIPYYCEENVWMYLRALSRADGSYAVFVSNVNRSVRFFHQRNREGNDAMVWDYHVVALVAASFPPTGAWLVRDFNCVAGNCLSARDWLSLSFPDRLPDIHEPLFKIVPSTVYLSDFVSDRTHMLDSRGSYVESPPSWPRIGQGTPNLDRLIDMNDRSFGPVLTLDDFSAKYARQG